MRVFLGLFPPPELQGEVAGVQNGVRAAMPEPALASLTWVRAENMHVTLKFLGETPPDRVAPLVQALTVRLSAVSSFVFSWGACGHFPAKGSPRMLWIGVDEGRAALTALAAAVDDTTAGLGWPKEDRPFRPHLTLARAKHAVLRPNWAAPALPVPPPFQSAG